MTAFPQPARAADRQIETADDRAARLAHVEAATGPAVAFSHYYDDDEHVPEHKHSRAQLLHPSVGVVTVTTGAGRWMVPPGHALWIPAGIMHAVDTFGRVEMHSVYVRPDAIDGLPRHLHVTGMTTLMRSLIIEAIGLRDEAETPRARFLLGALLHEILELPERPLGLPFPSERRLAELCREFMARPSAHLGIDQWADAAGLSRRSFTRIFRRETGLSLSTWRQQACLLAALPRLSAGEAVTAVALDLGYDSVPAFTTMFRRMMGTPPKTYLRNQAPG
ncbi:MAG: helix-turn-helix transcriptional regulator [Hoeflea sp.]|uniref:AraC family transcriptional regulator n=1 Tax=Hoeflea sp. TaxID=1940281 RepID=UPI002730D078|nr:helix-turn-helix transcriptional regulator [Hoeflea sp.]MDP2118841.1 helix-turn-helix transcriptional regulator [Hoeflea sp.]